MEDQLDLSILDGGNAKQATILARREQDLAIETVPLDALHLLTQFRDRIHQEIRGSWPGARLTERELVESGRKLFDLIIRSEVRRLYDRLPDAHVRIQVISNRAEIQALPWEFMQEPAQVPGPWRLRSIVRIVPSVGRPAPTPLSLGEAGKVRVLFISADPQDQSPVSWPESKELIERTFRARLPESFELEAIEGASPEDLANQVTRCPYHILHFSGHGEVIDGVGHLILVDRKKKKTSRMNSKKLSVLLAGRSFRLVVLSACETAAGNFAEPFAVIAEALVKGGVPAVVANQLPAFDQTVAVFAGKMYETLLNSGDIDQAVGEGRVRLFTLADPPPNGVRLDWGIPTLYRHIAGSRIFRS
jgi:hypothetical protein